MLDLIEPVGPSGVDRATSPRRPARDGGAPTGLSPKEERLLKRRLRRTSVLHHGVERLVSGLDIRDRRGLKAIYKGLNYTAETVDRLFARVPYPGQPNHAAIASAARLPQQPHYQGYWYDPSAHALVGIFLGLDLNRHRGRYHLIESNTTPAIRPQRRCLYDCEVDPFITELVEAAKSHGFRRILFCRDTWPASYVEEFARADRTSELEVRGASFYATKDGTERLVALPQPLASDTVYVLCWSLTQKTPLMDFVHDKFWSAGWLARELERAGGSEHLACVPTLDRLVLPDEPPDDRWPNLVVKLADMDKGRYVVMGRFSSVSEAEEALGVSRDDPGATPSVFRMSWPHRMVRRAFPRASVVYQPFVPPDTVDGHARTLRLNMFISPLFDTFLAAQARIVDRPLPDALPWGLVADTTPFTASFSAGGSRYAAIEPEIEPELRIVADDFGRLARSAIVDKFETGPSPELEYMDRNNQKG